MMEVNKFKALSIGLASPEKIRSWSYGEVKKPETINYRTLKPEKDGLFCERIFGPSKDLECSCGKYKRVARYKGIVCDRCGVEVTYSRVRRERMGHIELAAPVAHIWFFKGIPTKMGLLLDMSTRALEEVIYFVSYVVIDPGMTPLEKKQLLSEKEYRMYYEKYGNSFKVGMGAEAIRELLKDIDLEREVNNIREELKDAKEQKRSRLLKRLEVVTAFLESGNKPEWMVLDVLPVIPPALRPMIQLDGGRFATSDLNDLYRRVINRNNRLKKLLDLGAPTIIVQNEKRMLQEAVDALFDNGRRGRPITGAGKRPLKSLSHMLKGKQGRFRLNLLGKRVDYSGRSVIVVGPNLKMYECGLPKEMAIELFKPHVIQELVKREIAHNIKSAKKMIEAYDERVWPVVEDIISENLVLLNRAPTLHRLGIQAFSPRLIDDRAIQLHPLVCTAFNADFDGDQMAVHVPLSQEAQAEARLLMLASNNILNPKDGKPVVTPSQDMVLGNYYLTREIKGEKGEGSIFKDFNEAMLAYENGYITLYAKIAVKSSGLNNKTFTEEQKNSYLITTLGKLIFNSVLPEDFQYINEPTIENIQGTTPDKYFVPMGANIKEHIEKSEIIKPFAKKHLSLIISEIFKRYKTQKTSEMLDKLKDLGFYYATVGGFTISLSDIEVSKEKPKIIEESEKQVAEVKRLFQEGLITEEERYKKVIKIWEQAKSLVQKDLETNFDPENPIYMMRDSSARGNISNFTQLAGMRGLMSKPTGEPIEVPIKSSFSEGLTVSEFFISTHGARKGSSDTALKTADSGYLTRRLVDVAQDVIVRAKDCETDRGVVVCALIDERDGTLIENLYDRIIGRFANKDVIDPKTGEIIIKKGEIISQEIATKITNSEIEEVEIRSILTCDTPHGVCAKCYGTNLATGEVVQVGETVGIMAAQSIGEPGTQLTMRTFHTGGVSGDDITQGLPRVQELFEARTPKVKAVISEIEGIITNISSKKGRYEIEVSNDLEKISYISPYDAKLAVKKGDKVVPGQKLTEGSISPKELLAATSVLKVQEYIIKEIQKVYRSQGVDILDKHIEIMVRRMLSRIRVIDAGSTNMLPGSLVSVYEFTERNKETLEKGGQPAIGRPVILGITKASLETDSFLSAASFQETTRVLTDAAVKGKIDNLIGLKENVILGKIIPAGTGSELYQNVGYRLVNPQGQTESENIKEIVD